MAKPLPTPDILGDLLGRDLAKKQMVNINTVRVDGGTQMRAGLNEATVQEYYDTLYTQERVTDWPFPPIVVFHDGQDNWLADGFHRLEAVRRLLKGNQVHEIPADIRAGTRRDAIIHAAGANANHGLRRSQADKRRAVETMLRDDEWRQWSDREIARSCNVSADLVGTVRKELANDVTVVSDSEPATRTFVTKHGTPATMQVGNINAKREPSYASVWRLESVVSSVATHNYPRAESSAAAALRAAARDNRNPLRTLIEDGLDNLNLEFRGSDLNQAINNVASQLEQKLRREQTPTVDVPIKMAPSSNNVPYQNTPAEPWETATQGTQLAGKSLADYTDEDWAEAARIDAHRRAEEAVTVGIDSEPVPVRTVVDPLLFKVADDAYSAPELSKKKIRKPFFYDGAMWTCVGVSYGGTHNPESTRAECLRLHVVGEPIAPGERPSMYLETAYTAGTVVTHGGFTYVLGAQWMYVKRGAAPVTVDSDSETPEPAPAVDDVPVSFRADYDSDEWYTPEEITRTAHHVMGSIDLDPATCELAQTSVQAGNYFTKVDDGLGQPWTGNVWLNPPYSAPQVWIDKLFAEMASGRVSQAIVLVNNATETAWFQRLLTESKLVCFPARRLAFWRHDHSNVAGRQGQALFYFGNRADAFFSSFSATGAVLRRLAK